MKKSLILIAALGTLILSSCSKMTSEAPNAVNSPITYQSVQTAISTKAVFATTASFGSFAFINDAGNNWADNHASAGTYINNAEIKYFESAQTVSGVTMSANSWHADGVVYYWPKQGSLTFFAYTPYTIAVSCDKTDGIKATDYDVDTNVNTDFMVADIAADKSSNAITYLSNGVPTLFRHKLCTVSFNVKTDKSYAPGLVGGIYSAGDKIYELKSITIKNVASKATFTQGVNAASCKGAWDSYGTANKSYNVFSGTKIVTTSAANAKTLVQYTFMPQIFTTGTPNDAVVEIAYTVKTFNSSGNGSDPSKYAVENVTESKKLYDLQSAYNNAWSMNKAISYNIIIGADVIYWDPSVVDWNPEFHDADFTH